MQAVFCSGAPAVGIHDLRPLGPWPLPGTVPSKDGRVPGVWSCTLCCRSAGNTSRAKVLARQPCSGAAWVATPAVHCLELDGEHWRCSRCWLAVRPPSPAGRAAQCRCSPWLASAGWRVRTGSARCLVGYGLSGISAAPRRLRWNRQLRLTCPQRSGQQRRAPSRSSSRCSNSAWGSLPVCRRWWPRVQGRLPRLLMQTSGVSSSGAMRHHWQLRLLQWHRWPLQPKELCRRPLASRQFPVIVL